MISDNIRNLFKFIEYLHANIDNFNMFNTAVLEWYKAHHDASSSNGHYKVILRERKHLETAKRKENELYNQMVKPIKDEAERLEINLMNDNSSYNQYSSGIHDLRKNFEESDRNVIMKAKRQYLSFRNGVHNNIISYWRLLILFTNMDRLMSIILESFYEKGDKDIPVLVVVPYEQICESPASFNLQVKLKEVNEFYNKLIIKNIEVISEDTDFDYFAYAINGNEIPLDKTPFKPVRLVNTVDSMYRELLTFMKNHDIISEDTKTIPKKYRDLTEHLFLNSTGRPLKLRTPK